jgi:glycosyltransferase involved in cell wall biosynthesis
MTWMILICHLPERAEKLRRLTRALDRQKAKYNGLVDYEINPAGTGMPTGTKRNLMISSTMSDYFSFCDDDDLLSDNYVDEIMKGIETGPDVITFDGFITEYGKNRRNFTIRLGSRYYDDPEHPQFYYHRFPNHLAVMKRSVVQNVHFPPIWEREDFEWADKIRDKGLLKTEYHVNDFLYHYDCNPKPKASGRRMRA